MRVIGLFLALGLCGGCSIEKFNRPPTWASAITSHERFFGLDASIPVGGGERVGVKLGWGSAVWCVLPCSTNRVYVATICDTFTLGQGLNPFDTEIREDLQTGWIGNPSAPRHPLFAPKDGK